MEKLSARDIAALRWPAEAWTVFESAKFEKLWCRDRLSPCSATS